MSGLKRTRSGLTSSVAIRDGRQRPKEVEGTKAGCTGKAGGYETSSREGVCHDDCPPLMARSLLLHRSIDQQANTAKQQVRHADHEVDAQVIGTGFEERVLPIAGGLRTGGSSHRVLSGWTGIDRPR